MSEPVGLGCKKCSKRGRRRRSWPKPQSGPGPLGDSSQAGSNADKSEDGESKKAKDDGGPADDRFYATWDKFTKKQPTIKRTSTVANLDRDVEGRHQKVPGPNVNGLSSRENAATPFDEAAETCRRKVKAIVKECKRLNKKYHDPLFDLRNNDSLVSLTAWVDEDWDISAYRTKGGVADVKRVGDIFDSPKFFIDGATANDVRQGRTGDCWFLAAVTALSGVPALIEKLCVARDEQVGVYGFCFHRDGTWISEVVDDRLAVRFHEDQKQYLLNVLPDKNTVQEELPKEFVKSLHKGPDALYFASCRSPNETWLPLLEKAYAKAHLSYQSVEAGWSGEGIEDLTGGVNTTIMSEDVLDREQLWAELEQVNEQFLFGCGSRSALTEEDDSDVDGVVRSHAYTVLSARTVSHKVAGKEQKVKLLKVRNPWGKQEWEGAWSDGSKEWTPETMKALDHTFGDDGIFWISFEDFLKTYPLIDRTRLFGNDWIVAQQWTTVSVPRTINYLDTGYLSCHFRVTFTKKGPAVILLSQPDDRYFKALRGRYSFKLHFRVYRDDEEDYIVRSMSTTASGRSCSAEIDCEPGEYDVMMKLTPYRNDERKTAAHVIKNFEKFGGKDKVLDVGRMFDLAHSRGRLRETEIAISKQLKEEARKKRHKEGRATRNVEKEKRRKAKLQQQRIARKEKRKEDARKAREEKENASKTPDESTEGVEQKEESKGEEAGADQGEGKKEDVKEEDAIKGQEENKKGDADDSEAKKNSAEEKDSKKDSTEEKDSKKDSAERKEDKETGDKITDSKPEDSAKVKKEKADQKPDDDWKQRKTSISQPPEGSSSRRQSEAQGALEGSSLDIKVPPGDGKERRGSTTDEATKKLATISLEEKTSKDGTATISLREQEGDSTDSEGDDYSDNVSDIGSVQNDDFSWDSDIDGSVDDDSSVNADETHADLYEDDDWFALATIGLRIYSKDPDAKIEIKNA